MRGPLIPTLLLGLCLPPHGYCAAPTTVVRAAAPATVTVPMRDGTLLATDLYVPAGSGPWLAALARTPYNRTDFRNSNGGHGGIPSASFLTHGIALIVQDVRGTGASKGVRVPYDYDPTKPVPTLGGQEVFSALPQIVGATGL